MSNNNAKKAAICASINEASQRDSLNRLLDSIALDDLQSLLHDYVTGQESTDRLAAMFFATRSMSEAIGTDCTKLMMEYLSLLDLLHLGRVNKEFKALCLSALPSSFFDRELLSHPTFDEYFASKTVNEFRVGYRLQNEYSTEHLNTNSLDELGDKGLLKEEDLVMWTLCRHFKFKTDLLRWVFDDRFGGVGMHSWGKFNEDWVNSDSDDWYGDDDLDAVNGDAVPAVPHTRLDMYHKGSVDNWGFLCPLVEITCPDEEWRSAFLLRVTKRNRGRKHI